MRHLSRLFRHLRPKHEQMTLRHVRLLHFPNVRKTQVRKKCQYCHLTSLPNEKIHTFSKLNFSEHLGHEANGQTICKRSTLMAVWGILRGQKIVGLVPCCISICRLKRGLIGNFSSGRLSLVSLKLQQASAYYLVELLTVV